MARILPEELDAAEARGRFRAELDTLKRLAEELSDEYTVFHGVHWAKADESGAYYGEIDFVVMNRQGRVLAIEQKNGKLSRVGNEFIKTYANGPKSVNVQISRNIGRLRQGFSTRYSNRKLDIDHLLYCPDDDVRGPTPAGLSPDRVIDASNRADLCRRIQQLFDVRPMPSGLDAADPTDVFNYLSERIELAPNIDALHALARTEYTRMSSGLVTWASRLQMNPFRLRVVGTAGSGKTQLALHELQRGYQGGLKALYVCFNRSLADTMRRVAPDASACFTFHELGRVAAASAGQPIDWSGVSPFDALVVALNSWVTGQRGSIDLLIVDEGQDFEPAWADALLQLVKPEGRALWLEDPDQNLYRRQRTELPGWTTLNSPVCNRSPRVILTLINALALTDHELESGSAVHGFDPDMFEYASTEGLVTCTDNAVKALLEAGHKAEDIAVLSWRGLATSAIVGADTIAGLATRRFSGQYSGQGEPIITEGELLLDTIHRFKGQSADCVVLTELDFADWTVDNCRRLFVGLTRARLKVSLVASSRACREIERRLAG